MTELRKQQNRLAFGEVKDEGLHDLMGGDMGMVGSAMGTGKVKVCLENVFALMLQSINSLSFFFF